MTLRKLVFIFFHSLFDPRFYPLFLSLKNDNQKPYSFLVKRQEKKLRKLIAYVYKYVPYYKEIFDKNHIKPGSIKKLSDLYKIPILTKEIINQNIEKFKPHKRFFKFLHYFNNSTGGTTGTPMEYKISRLNRLIAGLLIYRGWSNAGYEMGDKMIILAGSSLGNTSQPSLYTVLSEKIRNIVKLSAFDMDDLHMKEYLNLMTKLKPKYIYGYPSALFFFSQWLEKNKYTIPSPKAIFTTSENLYPYMRCKIEKIFNCKIFDAYGLHDGGVTCHECAKHRGMHIDTVRSILEVVNKKGHAIKNGSGNIIATDLDNFVFPFIRYNTGDIGKITSKPCSCGITTPIITKILGRSVDFLTTPEGKNIHGWYFQHIFWEVNKGIEKYQVIQIDKHNIQVKLITNNSFDYNQLSTIENFIKTKSKGWKITFKFVKKIELSKSGKQKYIINKFTKKTV